MTRGEYITELRKSNNYTQDYVADKLGLTRSAISKYEHDASEMSLEIMEQMSIIYDDRLINIIYGDSNAYKNIEKDIEKLHYEKHQSEINNLKLKKKLSTQILTTIISITILILLFFVYYFINTYKSIKLYRILPEDKELITFDNSILILTNDKIIITINNIKANKDITKIDLFYNNFLILSKENSNNVIFSDNTKSQLYFNFNTIKNDINNLYLKTYTKDEIITTKLLLKKVYNNNSLIFFNEDHAINTENKYLSNIVIDGVEYNYYNISDSIIKFNNYENDDKWLLNLKGNDVFYSNNKESNSFQYNLSSRKYIYGEPNDEKLKLFFKLYEEFKKLGKTN